MASNLPELPSSNSLTSLDTSMTLSRLKPLDLALKASLEDPTKPDVTKDLEKTVQTLYFCKSRLGDEPAIEDMSIDALEARSFKWLVMMAGKREELEREIERLDILADAQILATLYTRESAKNKMKIQGSIKQRKSALEARKSKSVEEVAIGKARELKEEPEGWNDEEESE
jgi:hypothetical protein